MTIFRLRCLMYLFIFITTCLVCSAFAEQPYDDLTLFISKHGQPDQIKSSEYEEPRPPIVTKQIIYKKENVRAVYVPEAPIGSSPPYKKWKLLGFQDQRTNEVLDPNEVVRRLDKRQKK